MSKPKVADPKRKLLMQLRRRVQVQRRFDVEVLSDGQERQTCRVCGTSRVVEPYKAPDGRRPTNAVLIEKLSKYRAHDGVTGVCKVCSKVEADKLYPLLPPKKKLEFGEVIRSEKPDSHHVTYGQESAPEQSHNWDKRLGSFESEEELLDDRIYEELDRFLRG